MSERISSMIPSMGGNQTRSQLRRQSGDQPGFHLGSQGSGLSYSKKGQQFRGSEADSLQISKEALKALRERQIRQTQEREMEVSSSS